MSDAEELAVPTTIESLDDNVIIHVLSFLDPEKTKSLAAQKRKRTKNNLCLKRTARTGAFFFVGPS